MNRYQGGSGMESADRNARLIQDYLKGAKALEWNKYTLGEIGSRLWERLSEYNGSKEKAGDQDT